MELLGHLDRKNQTLYYDHGASDEHIFLQKNKEKFGPNWYYYDKKITYVYNDLGFRAKSLSRIDWSNSIVMFGCSCVEGVGNTLEDSVCGQLEKILQIPVINLGVSGSAVDLACRNSLVMHECYPHPKAVVHMWTALGRYSDFYKHSYIPVQPQKPKNYCAKHDWEIRSLHYIEADRALWRDKTIYYEASWFKSAIKHLKIDWYNPEIDLARDLDHPGVRSCKKAAEGIAENLIARGLK